VTVRQSRLYSPSSRTGRNASDPSSFIGEALNLSFNRPILVFGVVATTALLLGRFASARALATVASIGVEAGKLGNLAVPR